MQRINLWPNPNFDSDGYHVSFGGADISGLFVNNTFANTTGNDIDLPFDGLEDDVDYVCRVNIVEPNSDKRKPAVWGVNGSTSYVAGVDGEAGVKTIRFRKGSGTRLAVPTGMTIGGLLVERADTYDAAVVGGGASKLLHRGHHAARRPSRGWRHEPRHQPICRSKSLAATRRLGVWRQ